MSIAHMLEQYQDQLLSVVDQITLSKQHCER